MHSASAWYKLGAVRNNKGGGIFCDKLLPKSMKDGDITDEQEKEEEEMFTIFCLILWV